jgi:hypothetical protein
MKKRNNREQTITGIVFPDEWDNEDNVISVGIETDEGEEYIFEPNDKSKELVSLVDYEVQVTGTVRERLDGEMIIDVKNFEVFDLDEEDFSDDEYNYEDDEVWR